MASERIEHDKTKLKELLAGIDGPESVRDSVPRLYRLEKVTSGKTRPMCAVLKSEAEKNDILNKSRRINISVDKA